MKQPEEALALARDALIYLSQDADRIGRFLAVTGVGPAEIRERVEDPTFLAGVLDFILADDAMVVDFAEKASILPEEPARARRLLPGGDTLEY
ncbi:DUF3572 domain-containing protein [Hwanghaeella sp.]|uniref:DUF3572 domain-containing protein n=1 Tax=Hwanghaeella sp. TaxID=2605943 RepID=UPI003CCBC43D